MEIHHAYHCYCDGDFGRPLTEHIAALRAGGLYDELASFQIGFVGSPSNVIQAQQLLQCLDVRYSVCADVAHGWEQETLEALYAYSQRHNGAVLYCHSKGASRTDPIDDPWRRSMTQLCVVEWRTAVAALERGKFIVGCHWIRGNPDIERLNEAWENRELNPPGLDGVGGMFGGNFWWTKLEYLRRLPRPDRIHRHAAEHWLGQLSEVMPIHADTILDLNPFPIVPANLVPLQI